MTAFRKFHPVVRLKQMLLEPGGVTASAALAKADEQLDTLREGCLLAIDAKIEALRTYIAGDDPARIEKIYQNANQIFAEAGTFGCTELSRAAYSLCSLVSTEQGAHSAAAITVHVEALRALRHPDVSGNHQARVAVLEGLHAVTARIAGAPAG